MPITPRPRTWILLRGLTRERRHWGPFAQELQHCLPEDQIHAVDLPGNGALNHEPSPCTIRGMVDHCRRQLCGMGVHPPYALLAMSMGAMVAVEWARRFPEEVAGQVLINTSMRPFNPFYQRLRPANYGKLLRLAIATSNSGAREEAILRLTSNHATQEVLPLWRAWRQDSPVSRLNAVRQLWACARFSASEHKPAVPTLLLASAGDQLVSCACSKVIARHWLCDLRLHPSAGHDLPLDAGAWVAQQVAHWVLDKNGR